VPGKRTHRGLGYYATAGYFPPAFHVLYRRASWRRRIDSVGYNVLRAIKYEVFTGTFCSVELHSPGRSVQPLHYFDPLSVIVGAGKDVKARNFHVNLSHFRLWAAGSTTLTSSFAPVKITLVGLSNTGQFPGDPGHRLANQSEVLSRESLFSFCVDQTSKPAQHGSSRSRCAMRPGHDLPWYFWLHFANIRTSLAYFWKEFASWRPKNKSCGITPLVVVAGYHVARWIYRQSRLSKLSSTPGIKHACQLLTGYLVGRFNPPPLME
jgi:hypothetical protein